MQRQYSEGFYGKISPGSLSSAEAVLPVLIDGHFVQSIVDVGCGSGAWLAAARQLGLSDALGVDGAWARANFALGDDHFLECDLATTDPQIDRRFDLCISTEVAEHLPTPRSRAFVELLCRLSDRVGFSAAIPGQGGVHHVNEQWQSYWIALFAEFGFGARDVVRTRFWTSSEVEPWYRQNMILFERGAPTDVVIADIVHPFFAERGIGCPPSTSARLRRVVKAGLSTITGRH